MSAFDEVKLLTIDEYLQLPDDGLPSELVLGKVVKTDLHYPYHGYVCANIARLIGNFVEKTNLGRMFGNSGWITHRNPDSLRGADVSFMSYARFPDGPLPRTGYLLDVLPEFVLEVLSPFDRWKDVLAKVTEYLTAGVTIVCVVDPKSLTAMLYRADELPQTFDNGDTLTISDVLPGFQVPVRQFFE